MATKIRLARGGSKKRPFYRIVIADERAPRDGNFIEKIGNFNPMVPKDHKERVVISKERAEHWLKVGAQPTDRVQRILSDLGLMEAPKFTEKTKKHLPKAKAQERIKAKEEAALKAEEEAKAAAEAAKAEAEKPAEEPATEEPAPAESAPEVEAATEEAPAATEETPAESEEVSAEPEAAAEEEQPKE
ncbi:30S ribosomal protein S16 [Alphaproteobacteria bacterium]|nr:30S ribosomal protein S16 [Alphaproteobacteria bacterium]